MTDRKNTGRGDETDNLPERSATSSEIVFYETEDGRSRIGSGLRTTPSG